MSQQPPFSITFPSIEHAVSELYKKVFGATLVIQTPAGSEKCVDDGGTCGLGGYCPECPHGERPTPMTNALADEIYASGIRVSEIRMLQHARNLERQLAEAREDNATSQDFITTLRCELDEAREQRDRLADALKHAVKRILDFENYIEGKRCAPPATDAALKFAERDLAAVNNQPQTSTEP